jgi:ketosteroid isomerase-like protein
VTAREDIAEEVIPAGNDHAIEVGHYSYQGTSKTTKKPVSSFGRYMVLWQKDSTGVWHLQRDIGTEAPAKAVAPVKKA